MGSQAFNPSTREVETGAIWVGRERNIKGKRQEFRKYGVWGVESLGVVETGSCPFAV